MIKSATAVKAKMFKGTFGKGIVRYITIGKNL